MIKDNKKGITPTDLKMVKEKINLLYSNGEIFNLTFIKGKQKKQKECKICGVYSSFFRVVCNEETISVNYVDLLIGLVEF